MTDWKWVQKCGRRMAHLWLQIQHPSHIWIKCSNICTAQLHY